MALATYRQKRTFGNTPEPKGKVHNRKKALRFVIQKHNATHLHYDFRLEMQGVLKSWAVPKGPSMDPEEKHLAVMVEDHPYDYRNFEGVIPKGNYGAGTVEIWDEGTYTSVQEGKNQEKFLLEGLDKGDLKIILHGRKLKGEFVLARTKKAGEAGKNWLIIKKRDAYSSTLTVQDAKKSAIPHEVKPMLAVPAEVPFTDSGWLFEVKWDGFRAISEIQKGKVRLYSRNNQTFNNDYPEIVEELQHLQHDVVMDGEIVALDKNGTPQFQLLQDYHKDGATTLAYYVFDLLHLDGYDVRSLPLIERKKVLKRLLQENEVIKYSDHIDTDGLELFSFVKKRGIEGIMAKRKESTYVSDRTADWQKIKNIKMQEAVICGYTQGKGNRKAFGALILGVYNHGELQYIGHTGSGFDDKKLEQIFTVLQPFITDTCPFSVIPKTNTPATWVKPKYVCQIKFTQWTRDGLLRHPIFLGLREDKKPDEVVSEAPEKTAIHTKVPLTNFSKLFWPDEGYTKGDIIAYYDKIAEYILPYLKDRPESLNRHPDGIKGESFYHKDLKSVPKWVKTVSLFSESEQKHINWLVCNDRDTLLYMANLGCIEINPWSSRYQKTNYPDYLIIDLDPNGTSFREVIKTALIIKEVLDRAKMTGFVKTSGKTGLHIFIPLGAKYTFEQTRQFAQLIATIVNQKLPDTTSINRNPEKRGEKVYIDFLQNRIGQTIAAPYSIRPVPQAAVSTPLEWSELTPSLHPTDFTIKNIFRRLSKKGDIWEQFRNHRGINMLKSLEILTKVFPTNI